MKINDTIRYDIIIVKIKVDDTIRYIYRLKFEGDTIYRYIPDYGVGWS